MDSRHHRQNPPFSSRLSSHPLHPPPPTPMKPQPPALAPQNGVISEGHPPHPPNMSFLPPENGIHSLAQQEEERKRLSARIGQQAETMYGPDCKITQSQWNEAVAIVERMEEQERRQRDEMAMHGQNGRRREWMRRENVNVTTTTTTPPSSSSGLPPPPPPSLHPPTHIDSLPRSSPHRSSSPRMYSAPTQTSALPPPPPPFAARSILGPASPPYPSHPLPPRDSAPPSIASLSRDLPSLSSKSSMSISSMLGGEPAKARENGNGAHSLPQSLHHSNASSPGKTFYANGIRHQSSPEAQKMINRVRASPGSLKMKGEFPPRMPSKDLSQQVSPRSECSPDDWRAKVNRHSDPGKFMHPLIDQPITIPNDELHRRNVEHDRQAVFNREYEIEALRQSHGHQSNPISKQDEQPAPLPSPPERSHSSYPFLSAKSSSTSQKESSKSTERHSNVQKGPFGPEALRRIRDDRLGTAAQQRSAPPESRPSFVDALDDKRRSDSPRYNPAIAALERSESVDGVMQNMREGENGHRNSLGLALEHSRRTGRSPLPQAVQGAANQSVGPSRDPNVKHEFKKLFAGIGSGVSSSGLAGSGASTPFPPSPKQTESRLELDIPGSRNASRMGNKRQRRLNDEREREGSSRPDVEKAAKRMRHHQYAPSLLEKSKPLTVHSHHHHRHLDDQSGTPVRVIGDPIATNNHHHHHRDGTIHYHSHGHNHPKPSSSAAPSTHNSRKPPPAAPKPPSLIINNDALLSSISNRPRTHLGTIVYAAPPPPSPPSAPISTSPPPTSSASASDITTKFTTMSMSMSITPTPTTMPSLIRSGNENSTLTVLIPRSELTREARQEVCTARHLWGAGVYTADSDPLAAAVHGGWVQGWWGSEWTAGVVYNSLNNNTSSSTTTSKNNGTKDKDGKKGEVDKERQSISITTNKTTTTTTNNARNTRQEATIPSVPPPEGKEARLTILVLPPLTHYPSVIRHGVKSRACSGPSNTHEVEPASFMIVGLEWVDVPTLQHVGGGGSGRARRERVGRLVGGMGVGGGRCAVGREVRFGFAAGGRRKGGATTVAVA